MIKDNKLFILIIILVAAIIFRIFLDVKKVDEKSDIKYILFDNFLTISVFNNTVKVVDEFPNVLLKSKVNVFIDGNYYGNYYVKNINDSIKIYDENNNSINYNGSLVINNFDSSMRVSKIEVENTTLLDYDIATSILQDEGITAGFDSSNSDYIKYRADFDNDGNYEYIYSLSNMFSDVSEGYSILFTYNNDKYNIISKDVNKGMNGYELSILAIADINSDGQLDIIVGKAKFGNPTSCYEIYKSNNLKFKLLKGCK